MALSVPPQFSSLHNLQSEKALSAVICFIAVTSFFGPIFSQVDFYFHQSSLSPTLSIRPTVGSLVCLFTLLASHQLLQPIAIEHALILFLVLDHALSLPVLILHHATSPLQVASSRQLCNDYHNRGNRGSLLYRHTSRFSLCTFVLFCFCAYVFPFTVPLVLLIE